MVTYLSDGGLLKEQADILPEATPGAKNQIQNSSASATVATFGDTSLPFSGIIYRRWLDKPDCPDHGKSYVGETTDEAGRNRAWKKPKSREYAGARITEARATYGLLCWGV